MRILTFNPGSTSLKFECIESKPDAWGRKIFLGSIDPLGQDATFTATLPGGEKLVEEKRPTTDQGSAAAHLLSTLQSGVFEKAGVRAWPDLDRIACRVVHGASRFLQPVQVDAAVLCEIEALDDLAPLHNAQSVSILRTCMQRVDRAVPVVAIFDSAFHATLPEVAYRYAIDCDLADRHGIRRYGFHGISHRYLTVRYAELTKTKPADVNIITLHLGGGCSATAIQGGQSVDTSMGFTPLAGLMMGTRCGDLDPAIVGFLARKEKTDASIVEDWLNHTSGLLGVSGCSQDTRILASRSDPRSRLALEMFAYRVRNYIGSYLAAMGGARAVVFAGGIGENSPEIRARICDGLECIGLALDPERNREMVGREGRISRSGSRLEAWVIPTEEGLMMARDAAQLGLR